MARLLVIEDDEATVREIQARLAAAGHEVEVAGDGAEGLRRALTGGFDAVTLDRMLPSLDGIDVVQALRRNGVHTPVLIISALSDVDERISGIRAGGDDYLSKPFSLDEMTVRVEALLRRRAPEAQASTSLRAGDIRIDLLKRVVQRGGQEVKLLPMEFKLLEFLARNAGAAVSRKHIFASVWGHFYDPGPNLIAVHVARLRRKLGDVGEPPLIETVKGAGYRLNV